MMLFQVVDSHVEMRIDLGSDDRILSLPHVNVSDGLWHTVQMKRFGNQAMLSLDGGSDSKHYIESDPEDGHRLMYLDVEHVYGGADVNYPPYWNDPEVTDVLANSKQYFPVIIY